MEKKDQKPAYQGSYRFTADFRKWLPGIGTRIILFLILVLCFFLAVVVIDIYRAFQ